MSYGIFSPMLDALINSLAWQSRPTGNPTKDEAQLRFCTLKEDAIKSGRNRISFSNSLTDPSQYTYAVRLLKLASYAKSRARIVHVLRWTYLKLHCHTIAKPNVVQGMRNAAQCTKHDLKRTSPVSELMALPEECPSADRYPGSKKPPQQSPRRR